MTGLVSPPPTSAQTQHGEHAVPRSTCAPKIFRKHTNCVGPQKLLQCRLDSACPDIAFALRSHCVHINVEPE